MLKFISGTVASGKTLELLTKAHQFGPKQNAKHIKILKPSIDTRYARDVVRSASGMQVTATDVIGPFDNLHSLNYTDISLILVDEIQFFTITQIQQLREISYTYGMSVYCYGILKDFKNKIFDSSAFLISICDSFKFVKCYCALCERAQGEPNIASCNMRISKMSDGSIIPVVDGDSICIGGIETFIPTCYHCFEKCTKKIKQEQ